MKNCISNLLNHLFCFMLFCCKVLFWIFEHFQTLYFHSAVNVDHFYLLTGCKYCLVWHLKCNFRLLAGTMLEVTDSTWFVLCARSRWSPKKNLHPSTNYTSFSLLFGCSIFPSYFARYHHLIRGKAVSYSATPVYSSYPTSYLLTDCTMRSNSCFLSSQNLIDASSRLK